MDWGTSEGLLVVVDWVSACVVVGRGVIGEIIDVGEVMALGWEEERRGCGEEAVVPLGLRIQDGVHDAESAVFRRGLLKCDAALPKV